MKTIRDTGLLAKRSALQLLRNPAWVFVGLSTPLLYLGLFTPLLRGLPGVNGRSTGSLLDEFLPGILSLFAFSVGIGPGFTVIFELQAGIVERLRVTPTARVALLAGPILANILSMFVFNSILIAVGVAFGFQLHFGLLIVEVLAAMLAATVSAFSMALALRSGGEIQGFAAIMNGINLPVLLLGGVLLPLAIGPLWLRILGHFDPLYYLVSAARTLSQGHIATTATWQGFAVLTPLCFLTVAWATHTYKSAVA